MTSDYIPRPLHFIFPAALIIAGSLIMPRWFMMGFGLWALGLLAAGWIFIAGLWMAKASFNYSVVAVAREIKDMDPARYRALGISIPEIRIYPSKDSPIEFLEDTEIRMDLVREFIHDSDEYQFAPERLYGDGTIKRRQWFMFRDWLIEKKYLIETRTMQNLSWLWRPGRRSNFMRLYLGEYPISIPDLNEEEITA